MITCDLSLFTDEFKLSDKLIVEIMQCWKIIVCIKLTISVKPKKKTDFVLFT